MRVAATAWVFVLPTLALGSLLGVFLSWWWLAVAILFCVGFLFFFRDPRRSYDGPEEIALAPADGVITRVETAEDPAYPGGSCRRVVTFLSVFDVHVQRCPTEGTVTGTSRRDGRKVAAFRDDAGEVNASALTLLRRREGDVVGVRQVVGLVARRILGYLADEQRVERGQRLGLICFGSRVDLLVPLSYEILVAPGDRVAGGLTPMAMPTDPSSPPPADGAGS